MKQFPEETWVACVLKNECGQLAYGVVDKTTDNPVAICGLEENGVVCMKNAFLISHAQQMFETMNYLAEQFDALLADHGEPFGWGILTTEYAKELRAKILDFNAKVDEK